MLNKNKFVAAAFAEGACLVSLEFFAAQLLHPFYGTSYFVWIAVLSVTMLASAFGYILGGIIASINTSKVKGFSSLSLILTISYILAVYSIGEWAFTSLKEIGLFTAAAIHTLILIFLPILFITSFSPILVKYHQRSSPGKSSSEIFFASTIGGISAAYIIAFVILPNADLINAINGFALIIMLVFFIFQVVSKQYKSLFIGLAAFAVVFFNVSLTHKKKNKGVNSEIVYESHGIMGKISITDISNKARYIRINGADQSAVYLNNMASVWSYPYRVATYSSVAPANGEVLVAGLGGGALLNLLHKLNFSVDCVELDRRIHSTALKYMGLQYGPNIIIDDFRHYINATDKKYDLIILDLSKGETIPSNIYTVEAFRTMLDMLNPNGFIVLHYFSNVYGSGDFGLHSIMKTMERAGCFFGFVKKTENDKNPEQILIASNMPKIIPNLKYRIPEQVIQKYPFVLSNIFDESIDYSNGEVLHDGNAILEKVQFEAVRDFRETLRKNQIFTFYGKSVESKNR